MAEILFVENDQEYREVITELLVLEGYQVTAVASASEALQQLKNNIFDLLLTDLLMEKIDGLQLVELIRKKELKMKIIMLTGSPDSGDEVKGLDLSIDDYIKKPANFQVITKRIERVLFPERMQSKKIIMSNAEHIVMDEERRIVTIRNEIVTLTVKEFMLLRYFLLNKNRVLTREKILRDVWRVPATITDFRTIDTHVKNLRAKLGISSIYSIRGVGYEWAE